MCIEVSQKTRQFCDVAIHLQPRGYLKPILVSFFHYSNTVSQAKAPKCRKPILLYDCFFTLGRYHEHSHKSANFEQLHTSANNFFHENHALSASCPWVYKDMNRVKHYTLRFLSSI